MAKKQKPTYRYFVYKNGEKVNVDDLTPEEKEYASKWAYQTLVMALGYAPVESQAGART